MTGMDRVNTKVRYTHSDVEVKLSIMRLRFGFDTVKIGLLRLMFG